MPIVRGAARTAIAERFAQIAALAFGSQGAPVLVNVAPAEEKKSSGRFGRRR